MKNPYKYNYLYSETIPLSNLQLCSQTYYHFPNIICINENFGIGLLYGNIPYILTNYDEKEFETKVVKQKETILTYLHVSCIQ